MLHVLLIHFLTNNYPNFLLPFFMGTDLDEFCREILLKHKTFKHLKEFDIPGRFKLDVFKTLYSINQVTFTLRETSHPIKCCMQLSEN